MLVSVNSVENSKPVSHEKVPMKFVPFAHLYAITHAQKRLYYPLKNLIFNIIFNKFLKNSIRDARTPQPGEIFFNTMRYRSSVTVQSSRYFQSSVSYIKVQIMLK